MKSRNLVLSIITILIPPLGAVMWSKQIEEEWIANTKLNNLRLDALNSTNKELKEELEKANKKARELQILLGKKQKELEKLESKK